MNRAEAGRELEIHDLIPEPGEEWRRLLRFVGLGEADKRAMSRTVEALMRRAPEMVAGTYDHLLHVPETARILGWETGADPNHLEERRRFFTIWMARVLGLDTSDEFAYYLFRAGKFHAGLGPRRTHVPTAYVTTSGGLVGAAFARVMVEADLPGEVIGPAMAGWNKYLAVQLQLMHLGYEAGRALVGGEFPITFAFFARVRQLAGAQKIHARAAQGDTLEAALRKLFNYVPELRNEALQPVWHSDDESDSSWIDVYQTHVPTPGGWRFLLNGRDVAYDGGFATPVRPEDTISIFPPGR